MIVLTERQAFRKINHLSQESFRSIEKKKKINNPVYYFTYWILAPFLKVTVQDVTFSSQFKWPFSEKLYGAIQIILSEFQLKIKSKFSTFYTQIAFNDLEDDNHLPSKLQRRFKKYRMQILPLVKIAIIKQILENTRTTLIKIPIDEK